jgi:hypothetical protein
VFIPDKFFRACLIFESKFAGYLNPNLKVGF